MIGVSIARSTRSGSAVGPGICRKWRPTGREEFFDIASPYAGSGLEMVRRPAATSGVGICRHEGRMRESVKPLLRACCDALVAYAVHTLNPRHPEERPKAASRRTGGHSRAAVHAGLDGLARAA